MSKNNRFYFSTRDLMMMAALAALGGVASTYINLIGDLFQSLLGFAGTTQWAAGLHILWIMLAAALVGKPGAATATGILKGFVEFLSGNTHGLLVLIVNILAGLIIDLVMLPKKQKEPGLLFYLAAGLSSASNILVFQFFASIPEDVLTYFAILLTSGIAFLSGVLFGGIMVRALLASLRRIGIIDHPQPGEINRRTGWIVGILSAAVILALSAGFLYFEQQGNSEGILITGDVSNSFTFFGTSTSFHEIEVEVEINGIPRAYSGYPLKELVNKAEPMDKNGLLKITAKDGYSFFLSLDEVFTNPRLIVSTQETGRQTSYNIVGANSSKAWVRGVMEMKLMASSQLEISGSVSNEFSFIPDEWVSDMDSTIINLDGEGFKLQGVALRDIWQHAQPADDAISMIIRSDDQTFELSRNEFLESDEIRIFVFLNDDNLEYFLGRMDGEIFLRGVEAIQIQ